jgi:N-methylhydantoinase A
VHECTVDIEAFKITDETIELVKDAFHARHEELYTYCERHSPVEVVNIESTIYGRIDKPMPPKLSDQGSAGLALKGRRDAIFDTSGQATATPVHDGSKLGVGAIVDGPAIIEEVTTTIVVEPDWTAVLHESGSYLLTRRR